MSKLKSAVKWTFLLLPMCLSAFVVIGFAVARVSTPYRANGFIAHWAGIFSRNGSLDALRNLPQFELEVQGITNLAQLYPKIKGVGLKRWPTEGPTTS